MARLSITPKSLDWHDEAACRDADTAIFFPTRETDTDEAKAICATCPVAEACLNFALDTHQTEGVYGGMTGLERHRLVRRRQKAARKARQTEAA